MLSNPKSPFYSNFSTKQWDPIQLLKYVFLTLFWSKQRQETVKVNFYLDLLFSNIIQFHYDIICKIYNIVPHRKTL